VRVAYLHAMAVPRLAAPRAPALSTRDKHALPPRPAQRLTAPETTLRAREAQLAAQGEREAAAAALKPKQGGGATPQGLGADLAAAGRAVADKAIFAKRPYLRMAFMNPYNLSLLGGGLAASVLTMNPLPALVTLGLEAIWLLNAPDSKRLRHILWDPRFESLRRSIEASERAQRMSTLDEGARARVESLVARRENIQDLAAANPSFTGELLRGELVKTEKLVDAFVEMALTCARYESYLNSIDEGQLARDRGRYERAAEQEGPQGEIASKNLAVVEKRLEKMEEIRRYLSVAHGQLDLIENSFQLIADQIVTMQSPAELSGQLDELLDGVEAIRETSRDTEKLLGIIERG
jgi:hypothetical protein